MNLIDKYIKETELLKKVQRQIEINDDKSIDKIKTELILFTPFLITPIFSMIFSIIFSIKSEDTFVEFVFSNNFDFGLFFLITVVLFVSFSLLRYLKTDIEPESDFKEISIFSAFISVFLLFPLSNFTFLISVSLYFIYDLRNIKIKSNLLKQGIECNKLEERTIQQRINNIKEDIINDQESVNELVKQKYKRNNSHAKLLIDDIVENKLKSISSEQKLLFIFDTLNGRSIKND